MTNIVYATTNPGKFAEVQKIFSGHGITIHPASKYGVNLEVDETGETLEENAILKAEAYSLAINRSDVVVISDDTGLEIDALGNEPGIKVRRWKGYRMSDEEIINYTIERLSGVIDQKRTAHFRTIIAVAELGKKTMTFEGKLYGRILDKPTNLRVEGLPFQSLFYVTEYSLMLGDLHDMDVSQKLAQKIITHRERAVIYALPYLATLNH
ncbi:non-canonical purine NTP pyrophosphatase [Candidatus Woesebacteria bacterium]|nr:non-canonical purine NTP pyrophosphatase [Candidatus Woesebacteria bacterium]